MTADGSSSSEEPGSRPPRGQGFSVLDGLALVFGAAVASIHMRDLVLAHDLTAFGWSLIWITFAGVALTAAGPFVFLERRFIRRLKGHPRIGDWLWALLGVPWLVAALIRPAREASRMGILDHAGGGDTGGLLYAMVLSIGIVLACTIALGLVWMTWVLVPPDQLGKAEPMPWTEWLGLALAVAWPLQCGFGLVVMG